LDGQHATTNGSKGNPKKAAAIQTMLEHDTERSALKALFFERVLQVNTGPPLVPLRP